MGIEVGTAKFYGWRGSRLLAAQPKEANVDFFIGYISKPRIANFNWIVECLDGASLSFQRINRKICRRIQKVSLQDEFISFALARVIRGGFSWFVENHCEDFIDLGSCQIHHV